MFHRLLCALAGLSLLSGCGGSGTGNSSQVSATPAKTVVYSSAGDVNKYLGKWSTGCVWTSVTPNVFHDTTKFLDITAANGTSATGTLTVHDYGTNQQGCQGTSTTSTTPVTIQFVTTAAVDSTDFTGFSDQISYTPYNMASQILYASFNADFTRLRFTTSLSLSQFDGMYTRY